MTSCERGRAQWWRLEGRGEYWAAVLAVAAAAVALLVWRTDLYTLGNLRFADPGWDRHAYRELARRDLFDFKLAPYCWRVLVPWLAKAQPWPLQAGFMTMAVAALVAAGPTIFGLVRATGGSRIASVAMVFGFYSLGWAARYPLADFWVPDAVAFLLTVTVLWLIVAKRWWAACAVLAIGVLAKESVVFAGSLAFTWHLRTWRDWRCLTRRFLVVTPALLVLIGVRLLIQPENGNADYMATMPPQISRFPELFEEYDYRQRYTDIVVNDRWAHREWADFDRYLVDPFGLPLLLLATAGTVAQPKRAARLAPFILLVYSQLLFATDTQRLLVLAFPALAVLAGDSGAFAGRRRVQWDAAMLGGFAAVFLLTLFDANEFGAQTWQEAAAFVVGAVVGVAIEPVLRRRSSTHEL